MKKMGIVRKVDELGRIVLPIEIRRTLGIEIRDALEISVADGVITLQKYEASDVFTGETEDLVEFNGKKVARKNIKALAELAGYTVSEQ